MTEPKGPNFWSTLPGLVTAIAGMITAIAILVTTLATLPAFKPSESSAPSESPAGSPIASPSETGSATGEPSASSDGGASPGISPSADPGPRAILFYAVRVDPETSVENADLYAIDLSTGAERRLTTDARPDSFPAWSPDGTRIAFDSRRADGNRNLWVLEDDGSYTQLTNDAIDDGYPAWSPGATGGNARRITTNGLGPSWAS